MRPTLYHNADDLLANCQQINDCFVWPALRARSPSLSPHGTLAQMFYTSSIPRIMFTICRFPPSGRLIRCCNQHQCINPYHYVESKKVRRKRIKSKQPTRLLPHQEKGRHLIAPDDETLRSLRPSNAELLNQLATSAAQAGFDGKGVINAKQHFVPFRHAIRVNPDAPVLVIKRDKPVPRVPPSEIDALFSDGIFKQIELRKKRKLDESVKKKDW